MFKLMLISLIPLSLITSSAFADPVQYTYKRWFADVRYESSQDPLATIPETAPEIGSAPIDNRVEDLGDLAYQCMKRKDKANMVSRVMLWLEEVTVTAVWDEQNDKEVILDESIPLYYENRFEGKARGNREISLARACFQILKAVKNSRFYEPSSDKTRSHIPIQAKWKINPHWALGHVRERDKDNKEWIYTSFFIRSQKKKEDFDPSLPNPKATLQHLVDYCDSAEQGNMTSQRTGKVIIKDVVYFTGKGSRLSVLLRPRKKGFQGRREICQSIINDWFEPGNPFIIWTGGSKVGGNSKASKTSPPDESEL